MLGQKILETFAYDDDGDDNDPTLLLPAVAPSSLTLRRVKSKTLRIMTEGEAMSPLANRTNRQSKTGLNIVCPFVSTPDSSHTFGRPNPTNLNSPSDIAADDMRLPTAVVLANLKARRQTRYLAAERQLAERLRRPASEATAQELKIRALQRATDMLNAQARDAKERVTQLRECLADRVRVEPPDFRAMQDERWMADRRGVARDSQVLVLRSALLTLAAPAPVGGDGDGNGNGGRPTPCRKANLARFFERSHTRTALPRPRADTSAYETAAYRRNTITHVRAMRLRTVVPPAALPSPALRPTPIPVPTTSSSAAGTLSSPPPPLRINPESTSHMPSAADSTSTPCERSPVTPTQAPSAVSDSASSSVLSSAHASNSDDGFASIFASPSMPRSRAELLASLHDQDVALPAYALALLDELAADAPDVSLKTLHGLRTHRPPPLHRFPAGDAPLPSPALTTPALTTSPHSPVFLAPSHSPATPAPATATHARTQSAPQPHAKAPRAPVRGLRASLHLPRRVPQHRPSTASLYAIAEASPEAQPRAHSSLGAYASASAPNRGQDDGGESGTGSGRTRFFAKLTSRLAMGAR